MTTWQKSVGLWIGGGVLGLIGALVFRKQIPVKTRAWSPLLGAALGSMLVGSFGDATIERCQIGLWPCRR